MLTRRALLAQLEAAIPAVPAEEAAASAVAAAAQEALKDLQAQAQAIPTPSLPLNPDVHSGPQGASIVRELCCKPKPKRLWHRLYPASTGEVKGRRNVDGVVNC